MNSLKFGKNVIVRVSESEQQFYQGAADYFFETVKQDQGFKNFIFPGGSTPTKFFNLLTKLPLDWNDVRITLSDERVVDKSSPMSNTRLLEQELLEGLPQSKFEFVPLIPEHEYEDLTKEVDENMAQFIERPYKTLSVLGFGSDGHTASLFPGNQENFDLTKNSLLLRRDQDDYDRISLGYKVLLNSDRIMFLLKGEDKAPALHATLTGAYEPEKWPVQYLIEHFNSEIVLFCDSAAASKLVNNTSK